MLLRMSIKQNKNVKKSVTAKSKKKKKRARLKKMGYMLVVKKDDK